MGRFDKTVVFVSVAVALLSLAFAISGYERPPWLQTISVPVSPVLLVLGGVLLGVAVMGFIFIMVEERGPLVWSYVVLFCSGVMAVAAVSAEQLSFGRALLMIILGSVALVAAAHALARFRSGEAIGLESSWGGLGGGLGGWSISTVTSLTVLALVFAAAAVTVSLDKPNPGPGAPGGAGGKPGGTTASPGTTTAGQPPAAPQGTGLTPAPGAPATKPPN